MGSPTVLIGGAPAARMGDQCAHGGAIILGCPTVLIGGASGGGGSGGGGPGGGGAGGGRSGAPAACEAPDDEQKFSLSYTEALQRDLFGDTEFSRKLAAEYQWLEESGEYLKFGSDENNIRLGTYDAELKSEMSYDLDKGEFELTPIDAMAKVALAQAHAEGEALKGLVGGEANAEFMSAEAHGKLSANWQKGQGGAEASVGASAVAAKVDGQASVRLTPKTMYDNTVGRLTNTSLSKGWDKGISLGAGGEAGVGAAAEAKAGITKDSGGVSMELGAKVGAGPMLGLAVNVGIVW
jgi:hypothetical protein